MLYENVEFVVCIIEGLFFVDVVVLNMDYELVVIMDKRNLFVVFLGCDMGDKVVGGDLVWVIVVDGNVVDVEEEGGFGLVKEWLLNEFGLVKIDLFVDVGNFIIVI